MARDVVERDQVDCEGADPRARRRLGRAARRAAGSTRRDFRGERFREHPLPVHNDPDLLNLTQPEIVRSVHDAYFAAGADITTTNTFTATSIGQADYGLAELRVRDERRRRTGWHARRRTRPAASSSPARSAR